MTIDEAIKHCKEQVQEHAKKGCYSCAEEYHQLAEWLKELKAYKEQSGDAISRQAVLDLPRIKTHNQWGNVIKESVDVEGVRQLPSVNQEPFINKPCISVGICEHDKNIVLDKIRAEIEQIEINGHIRDVECFSAGINVALNVIDKYKTETE